MSNPPREPLLLDQDLKALLKSMKSSTRLFEDGVITEAEWLDRLGDLIENHKRSVEFVDRFMKDNYE